MQEHGYWPLYNENVSLCLRLPTTFLLIHIYVTSYTYQSIEKKKKKEEGIISVIFIKQLLT